MIKRILVALDPSPYSDAATEWACFLAKRHKAEVTGLVILDLPGIMESVGPVPLGGQYYAGILQHAREEEARERIKSLLTRFAARCDSHGVTHSESQLQGSPSEKIVQESIYYDALVMGICTYFHFETEEDAGNSLAQVLDHSITPVYAVPQQVSLPVEPGERMKVLLAFDGSLPAARALHRLAQLAMPDATDVLLFMSDSDRERAEHHLKQSATYLKKHSYQVVKEQWTDQPIIDALGNNLLQWCDMVVIGAHSKRSLLDFFLGSVTKYLIKEARKTVLIAF